MSDESTCATSPDGKGGTYTHPGIHRQTHYEPVDGRWLFTCADCGATFESPPLPGSEYPHASYGVVENAAMWQGWEIYLTGDERHPDTFWRCDPCREKAA